MTVAPAAGGTPASREILYTTEVKSRGGGWRWNRDPLFLGQTPRAILISDII